MQNKFSKMVILFRSVLYLTATGLLLVVLIFGCTIKKSDIPIIKKTTENLLPENIFRNIPEKYNPQARIMVFEFESPNYAPAIGAYASEIMTRQFLKNRIFRDILYEPGKFHLSSKQKIKWAEKNACSLAVFGRINYYYEGSMLQESRIDEEIKIFDVGSAELAWHAEATAMGKPVPENDYTLLTVKGEKAFSGIALLILNATKFCNLLSGPLDIAGLSEEMKCVEMGYHQMMVTKNNDHAEYFFQEALKINADNAHALLNLGVIYERRNQIKEAIAMYQKVILLNPQDIITDTNIPKLKRHPLVDLAKYNLARLQKTIE